jgi:pyruvate-formate lyase-activating enzyme
MGKGPLRDSYGRVADDLRISITDRCNFRCIYCMPAEGLKWLKRDDILRFEEITRLARIFVESYGVRTIRITGGEPLVRIKVEELVAMINAIDPTLDITMTTNGVLLREKAQALKEAGLKRINISLDTLNMKRFHEMARSDQFKRTMDGIQASREAGLWPIKLNMVVMKGHNDDEVVDFARLARDEGYEVLVRGADRRPLPARAGGGPAARPRDEVPLRGRRSGRDRIHLVGEPGVLHRVQPGAADRRRRPAHLPVLSARDSAARPDAVRRLERAPRPGDRVRDLAERRGPSDQQAGLRQAVQVDVSNRGVTDIGAVWTAPSGASRHLPRRAGKSPI